MTPKQLTLARKLTRHWRWQWMPGMRLANGQRVMIDACGSVGVWGELMVWVDPLDADALPDLTDPATIGCIAHLAIATHGGHLWAALENGTYFVDRTNPDIPTRTIQVASGPCLGSAWAAALLAAPEPQ